MTRPEARERYIRAPKGERRQRWAELRAATAAALQDDLNRQAERAAKRAGSNLASAAQSAGDLFAVAAE